MAGRGKNAKVGAEGETRAPLLCLNPVHPPTPGRTVAFFESNSSSELSAPELPAVLPRYALRPASKSLAKLHLSFRTAASSSLVLSLRLSEGKTCSVN